MSTYFCSSCQKELSKSNKSKHERTNKHQRLTNSYINTNNPINSYISTNNPINSYISTNNPINSYIGSNSYINTNSYIGNH